MRVLVTGADGFLGWHTRVRLRALTGHDVVPVTRGSWPTLPALLPTADAVIHLAGVNRGSPESVEAGNVTLAEELAEAVLAAGNPTRVVYASSIQAGNGTPYGTGKATAGQVLSRAAEASGAAYVDVRLPNLFGEHGRPHYNSFVSTFVDAVVKGATPTVQDRPVGLLHAQGAAQALLDALETASPRLDPEPTTSSVRGVYDTLRDFAAHYRSGDIPPLASKLDVDLFNTLRARLFPSHYPIALPPRADDRGRLVEVVRAHGGQGQTFVSTTRPGVTRGEHFHLHKVERFVVLSGRARISLRKVLGGDVVSFDVTGEDPTAVDMPTLWAHNIENTGDTDLVTVFWTHTLFDPEAPDTYAEKVVPETREALRC